MAYKKTPGQFFDSYAREFDAIFTNQGSIFHRVINDVLRKSTKLRYHRTLQACQPIVGKTVIDIGCGPGHYAVVLAKNGARKVLGIDVSPAMIALAKANVKTAGVEKCCEFVAADFASYPTADTFDYAIAQGFMDYVANPKEIIKRILSITKNKAFFSFPKDGGLLAWQRKIRYKWKCDLFMYKRKQLDELFGGLNGKKVEVESISRDFFVTVYME